MYEREPYIPADPADREKLRWVVAETFRLLSESVTWSEAGQCE